MTQFRIDVVLDPSRAVRGSKRVDRALNSTERQAQRLKRTMGGVFAVIGITTLITQLVRLSDTYTNMQNRLRLVTKGTRELHAVQKELFNISARTRSSLEATATIYSRTALSVRELGISHKETLNFVESLNHAIILSGVNSREASNGLIQLSQGIASNTLRGDELRAVLEQLPAVADVIAKHFEIGRGELRLLGAQGKISGEDIIDAFKASREELERLFKITVPTLGQAFDVLTGRVIEAIGRFNEISGFSTSLSKVMIILAENLDNVAKGAVVAGSALALHFVKAGVNVAIFAVRALTVAIAANPIGALVIVIIAGVTALIQFGDQITFVKNGIVSLTDVISVVGDILLDEINHWIQLFVNLGNFIGDIMASLFEELPASLREFEFSFTNILKFTAFVMDRFVGLIQGSINVVKVIFMNLLPIIKQSLLDFADELTSILLDKLNILITTFNKLREKLNLDPIDLLTISALDPKAEGMIKDVASQMKEAFDQGIEGSTIATDLLAKGLKAAESLFDDFNERVRKKTIDRLVLERRAQDRARRAKLALEEKSTTVDRMPVALREQLALLDEELRIMGLTNRERAIATKLLNIEQRLRASNVNLTEGSANDKLLKAAVRRNQVLKEQMEILNSLKEPQEALAAREENLIALRERGSITVELLTSQLNQLALAQAALNIDQGEGTFFDGFLLGMEEMLETVRNFEAEAGGIFADFFTGVAQGFSDSLANAIVFGDDLKESLGNAARQALASLLSGLINIGAQFVLNKAFESAATGSQLAGISTVAATQVGATAATEAAALAALGVTTAAVIASNVAIAASATAPAALVSLASYGANALPAQAGILSTAAVAKGAALFADGGYVSGAGGPRSDSIPARLSNGEFVVNAKSTSRFRPQLEAMNNGRGFADGGIVSDGTGSGSQGGNNSVQPTVNLRNINVLDPSLLGDFLATGEGEEVMLNFISSNSDTIKGTLA